MSEMVERVARALWPEFDDLPTDASQPRLARAGQFGMTQEVALENARAAIEAMYEPTMEMIVSGEKSVSEGSATGWRAMIDAAIREGD